MINGFYTCVDRKMNYLMYRGYDADGVKVYNKFKFKPKFFTESKNTNSEWTALDGTPLDIHRFDSMSESRQFLKQYEDVSSIRIHGNERHIPSFIQSQFPTEIKYKKDQIDVVKLDIETKSDNGFPVPSVADQEVTMIGLKSSRHDHYIVWGLKDYDETKSIVKHIKREYRQFKTEKALLEDFIEWWSDLLNTPDVVTGWNSRFFDIPYLVNRISRVLGGDEVKRLSPWGTIEQKTTVVKGREELFFNIYGIQQLDYMELFKKFTINTYGAQESYKLDFIAEVVLGENKISYSDDYGSLSELYEKNFNLFLDYNLVDVELIDKMEEKIGLISLVFTLAYFGGVNYTDTLGTVAIWDSIIFRNLALKKIAIPQNKISYKTEYAGGFVKESITGRHPWTASFDLNSLYPNLIVQYNMSPETIVDDEKVYGLTVDKMFEDQDNEMWSPSKELTITANGAVFRKDKKGVLPEIVEKIYNQRVTVKREMLEAEAQLEKTQKNTPEYRELEIKIDLASNKQMCLKILLNSLYGACGSRFFRYYNIDIAEGITLSGQYVIGMVEREINKFLARALGDDTNNPKDRVVAMDTDSNYVALGDIVDKCKPENPHDFCTEFAKQALEPIIEKTYDRLAKTTNAYVNAMKMKLEKVSDVAIFFGKKRYILRVLSSEGVRYKKPKIVMKGIEAVKSSTPKICREEFKDIFNLLIDKTERELQERVSDFRIAFNAYPIEKLAFPRGVSNVKKYMQKGSHLPYVKGTPINSRAAILYNTMVDKLGLDKKYPKITNGDRIKFIYLTKNNPTKENVIGFIDKLPPEFSLADYIDYDTLFDKTFIIPLQNVLDAVNWKAIVVSSLDEFFE